MNHAIPIPRLAFAPLLAVAIVSQACAQRPQLAPDTVMHATTCYALSYVPDTAGYYLPAFVQLIDDASAKQGSPRYHAARWRGGAVQSRHVHESFKLSAGTARWRQRGDSLVIETDPVLQAFLIRLQRLDTTAAPAASDSRAGAGSWRGRGVAYLGDGPAYVEGDVFGSTTACDP